MNKNFTIVKIKVRVVYLSKLVGDKLCIRLRTQKSKILLAFSKELDFKEVNLVDNWIKFNKPYFFFSYYKDWKYYG